MEGSIPALKREMNISCARRLFLGKSQPYRVTIVWKSKLEFPQHAIIDKTTTDAFNYQFIRQSTYLDSGS